jgi:hypothetical protein
MSSDLIITTSETLRRFVPCFSSAFGLIPQPFSSIFKRFWHFRDFQWVSDPFSLFPFVHLPSSTFFLFSSRLSSTFFKPLSPFLYLP